MRVTSVVAIIAIATGALMAQGQSLKAQDAKAQIITPLSGLKKISHLMEALPRDSGECGNTEDLERQAFMYPASSANFNIVGYNDNPDAWFYLAITSVHTL